MNNNIVNTKINYTYDILKKDVFLLKKTYPFLDIGYYGKSTMGKDLIFIKLGKGEREISYSASIHANEWITSVLLMKFVEDCCKIHIKKRTEIFENYSIYVLPMLNPDGVDLVLNNINTNSLEYTKAKEIADNYLDIEFPNEWKANIRGVDLNCQFPSMWENAKKIKEKMGYNKPSPRGFVGIKPLSEKESMSLYKFTIKHNFEYIITYHTQGEEIYHKYMDYEPENYKKIANIFSKFSGYKLIDVPENQSYAGYRDWFIEKYNRPGFTIEVGKGKNPINIKQFSKIYADNIDILIYEEKKI